MPGYLLTFFQKIESPRTMTSVFSADDDDGACEIAQQTLCDKRASTGTLYRYQQTQNRGLLVELCRIDPELTANYLPPSD